jgi:hypothetical protein
VRNIVSVLTEAVSLETVLGFLGRGQWEKYWSWGGCAEFAFGLSEWLNKNGVKAQVAADEGEYHFVVKARFNRKTVYLDAEGLVSQWGQFKNIFDPSWVGKSDEFFKKFDVRLDPARVKQLAAGKDPEIPADWRDPHAE